MISLPSHSKGEKAHAGQRDGVSEGIPMHFYFPSSHKFPTKSNQAHGGPNLAHNSEHISAKSSLSLHVDLLPPSYFSDKDLHILLWHDRAGIG